VTGLAWLPFGAGIVLGAGVSSKLVLRLAPRAVAVPGMVLGSLALLWLSSIGQEPNYFAHIMPAIVGLAFGFAMGVVSLTLTAVRGVRAQDTGIASALLNASQQIGVAFGLAMLSTISVTTTTSRMPDALGVLYRARASGDVAAAGSASDALINGYSVALLAGATALILAAVITGLLVNARKGEMSPSNQLAVH
jgi:predicted MFS family arabinose efflux permease